MSRGVYQVGTKVMQEIKGQASAIKPLKDSSAYGSSSTQAKKLSDAVGPAESKINKLKQAEESLRTVMYLSCWAPN